MYNLDLLDETAPAGKLDRAEYDDPWNYEPSDALGLLFDCSNGEMDDRETDADESFVDGLDDEMEEWPSAEDEEQDRLDLDARDEDDHREGQRS
jgi:hypothetical protein